jgi:hypothetical protein
VDHFVYQTYLKRFGDRWLFCFATIKKEWNKRTVYSYRGLLIRCSLLVSASAVLDPGKS